jgi:uncharacterized membrane-anchored protein YhcB (DUF1043 family)
MEHNEAVGETVQNEGAMNDIQSSGKLLEELREAYRSLPQHIQEHVTGFLRESTTEKQPEESQS